MTTLPIVLFLFLVVFVNSVYIGEYKNYVLLRYTFGIWAYDFLLHSLYGDKYISSVHSYY